MYQLRRKDIIYSELSYNINGALFNVFKELGYGHLEKVYQKAISLMLKKIGLKFNEQVLTKIEFNGEIIGKYFLDFLIEDKIILEIKQGNYFSKSHIEQIHNYLKANKLKLGLLANFTMNGVKIKRIVNIK